MRLRISEHAKERAKERLGLTDEGEIINLALTGKPGTIFVWAPDRLTQDTITLVTILRTKCVAVIALQELNKRSWTRLLESEIPTDPLSTIATFLQRRPNDSNQKSNTKWD